MILLYLGIMHYLEARHMVSDCDDDDMYIAMLEEELYYEELLREQEEYEVAHGWEDAWHGNFYDYEPE